MKLGRFLQLSGTAVFMVAIAATVLADFMLPRSGRAEAETELPRAYLDAVEDAKIAEPHEIRTDLTAIVASNENLQWEGEPGNSRVLVASWRREPYQLGDMTSDRQLWVTAVPELKNFCVGYKATGANGENLSRRLEQILGLPPNNGYDYVLEIWVKPENLFRPSPDPEISDREAELDFPQGAFVTVNEEHKNWFNSQKENSYPEEPINDRGWVVAYPWTRLGYTYDWGNPRADMGLSEFVIKKGAEISIDSVSTTEDYCSEKNGG